MIRLIKYSLFLLLVVHHMVWGGSCVRISGNSVSDAVVINSPIQVTVPLSGSFYVGNEMPLGTVIYRTVVDLQSGKSVGAKCDAPWTFNPRWTATSPLGPVSVFDQSTLSNKQVFPTNVPGIGVSMTVGDTSFSNITPINYPGSSTSVGANNGWVFKGWSDIVLVKTGNISMSASGVDINASQLPTGSYDIPAQSGLTGFPMNLVKVNFSGTIHFIARTCVTPDQTTIKMGDYLVSTIKQDGSTPWVDSSIKLSDCPKFSGYYTTSGKQTSIGGSSPSGGAISSNIFSVSLSPVTSVATDGSITLSDPGGNTDNAAKGVGLQVGYNTTIDADATLNPTIWKSGVKWSVTAPSDGRTQMKIPLSARYIKTGNIIPGPANAKILFNIDYK